MRALAVVALVASAAHADPTADQLADDAEAKAKAGDFAGAANAFRKAYALDQRTTDLCNVGVAFHKAKDLPRAHLYLSQCLDRGASLDAKFVTAARAVLAAAETKLRAGEFALVEIAVAPSGASVTISDFEPDDAFVGARAVWLPYGSHAITVKAEGYADKRVTVDAHERSAHVKIELERAAAPPPPPPTPKQVRLEPPRSAYVAAGATGLLALVTTGLYVRAAFAVSDVDPHSVRYDQQVANATSARSQFFIGAIVTGIGAGVATYLWFGKRVPVELTVSPTAVGVRASF